MNYQIIKSETVLEHFIDWLPDLLPHEVYVINLFARNKYSKDIVHINSDKAQMKRFTTTKEWMVRKIRQLETEVGTYWQQNIQIPQEALALYIGINPKSQVIAAKNLMIKLAHQITMPYNNYNVSAEALSEIQKATSRKIFFDIDIDDEDILDVKEEILRVDYLNEDAITVLQTRGGCHVIVQLDAIDKKYKNTWYNNMSSFHPNIDIKGTDNMIPVPGCTQGGFMPHFL